MSIPIQEAGFLVVQESSINGWSEFFTDLDKAEQKAASMLPNGHRVLLIPVSRFTTAEIDERLH
jgi:hypothetical protein